MTSIGEIAPPQNPDHAWVDDTFLLTSYQYDLQQPNSAGVDGLVPFIHQCGMYPGIDAAFQQGKQFWAPLVSENWDAANDQYSTVSLGMISNGPAFNRADVLMYQRTRDIGGGVFEITYVAYNYNSSYTTSPMGYVTDIAPWGGVRTSALPNLLLSKPDQTTILANQQYASPGTVLNTYDTGGWVAATVDPTKQNSYTMAMVFGSQNPSSTEKLFLYGTTEAARSFTVESVVYRQPLPPGKAFYCRQYYVLGQLSAVLPKATHYQQYAQSGFLEFDETSATTIPLYLDKKNGQTILSDAGTTPAFYVYAEPVKNSKPLYLIYETKTKQYHATCDPYNTMPRYNVLNDPQGRKGVRPYDGSTQILKLYGFVMPSSAANAGLKHTAITSVLTDNTFFTGKGLYDPGVVVRTTPN
ncbi:MAG: hypothetical protein EOP51_29635 [Sphingobacteriales bacterium]|nr:MAG: hypothetical protein EOP51_29635 [Sphingobacteriales bacterium]